MLAFVLQLAGARWLDDYAARGLVLSLRHAVLHLASEPDARILLAVGLGAFFIVGCGPLQAAC